MLFGYPCLPSGLQRNLNRCHIRRQELRLCCSQRVCHSLHSVRWRCAADNTADANGAERRYRVLYRVPAEERDCIIGVEVVFSDKSSGDKCRCFFDLSPVQVSLDSAST